MFVHFLGRALEKYPLAVLDSFVRKAFGKGLCCLGYTVLCSKN